MIAIRFTDLGTHVNVVPGVTCKHFDRDPIWASLLNIQGVWAE
jgi:hypothetical protein